MANWVFISLITGLFLWGLYLWALFLSDPNASKYMACAVMKFSEEHKK